MLWATRACAGAGRARPRARQKIYEVLDSCRKGFAQVVQEKTAVFRRRTGPRFPLSLKAELIERDMEQQRRHGQLLATELKSVFAEGQRPGHARLPADRQRTLSNRCPLPLHAVECHGRVPRVSRPLYAVDPLDEQP